MSNVIDLLNERLALQAIVGVDPALAGVVAPGC
jgi:hypothetical protein